MKVIYPSGPIVHPQGITVFLAGSIEMGKADNWQERLTNAFFGEDVTFFNPRRPDWDSSWKQDVDDPQFLYQVNWELDHLKSANIIALYLAPGTVSPISLLELGLYFMSDKLILCCPEGFARKGNVDITARRIGQHVCENFEEFIEALRNHILNL